MPRRPTPHRAAVARIRRALRAGQALAVTHCGCGDRYSLEPSGKPVPSIVAKLILRRRKVVPAGDGLFDATTQTWVLR